MSRKEVYVELITGRGRAVTGRGSRVIPHVSAADEGELRPSAEQAEIESSSQVLDAYRASLLAQKQVDLDGIIDKHDDMVREMFQMENFKNMLLYDPKVAKEDNTAVFREYKAKYDLVDNAAPVAGPSRQTRGRANERRQILKNTSVPPPTSLSTKRTLKPKTSAKPELENILTTAARSYKGKGKAKEVASQPLADRVESVPAVEDTSASTIFVRRKQAPSTPQNHARSADPNDSISTHTTSQLKMNAKTRVSSLKRPAPVPIDILEETEKKLASVVPELVVSEPSRQSPPTPPVASIPLTESISTGLARRSGRRKEPPPHPPTPSPVTLRIRPPISHTPKTTEPPIPDLPPTPKFNIKRIKLIVRRPPPSFTDPRQRPPPPKFNNSLPLFLKSYTSVDEDEPYADIDTLAQRATSEAAIRERVEQFRVAGRFIPGTEVLFGTTPPDEPYIPPTRTTRDIWDDIVGAIVAQAKTRPKKSPDRAVAGQIATRVQAHFAAKESRRTKARDVEERRLRNLAKNTMKVVIAEWKKAVYHIREKHRQEFEEEERRVGREHLASILDQSGQILETQQEDLTRENYTSRSRSGSIGGFNDDDEETDDEDEEGGTSQRSSLSHHSDDEEGDGEEDEQQDDDEGTSLLLAGDVHKRPHSPPTMRSEFSTPASMPSGFQTEDDPETATTQLLNGAGNALNDLMMYSDSESETDLEYLAQVGPTSSPQRQSATTPMSDAQEDVFEESEGRSFSGTSTGDPDHSVGLASSTEGTQTPGADEDVSRVQSHSREVRFVEYELQDDAEAADEIPGDEDQSRMESEVTNDNVSMQVDDEAQEDSAEHGDAGMNTQISGNDGQEHAEEHEADDVETDLESQIPEYLKPYAVAPVEWDPEAKVTPPLLLRGVLRPYQQSGLEWLASLHVNKLNGILADEMGLGKTIQTISLLAHLACDRGIWGPHLIIVPTSVILNWEMEFKKFLPGFRVLSYHGSTKRRKELRQGWNDRHIFNVCITSYTLASRDAHIFKRKAWYYMILDEAHMIKNFKSQRWNILLMFRSYRRLLLTGTPLQNNLTELWALLQFLMSGANFANLKEFGEWFSNPLEKAIEMGNAHDEDTMQTVTKLHTVLRPYLLRRLKRDVEKELPSKFEHLTLCPLSKRQRFLYDEFMERAQTRDALDSGVYQKIANILMQLRKVCNHPDLFEVRPIVTSFAMTRSAIADFEIKELLVRRHLLSDEDDAISLPALGLNFIDRQNVSLLSAVSTRYLDATSKFPQLCEIAGEAPPKDTRMIAGYRKHAAYTKRKNELAHWSYVGYLNKLRCSRIPIYSDELLSVVRRMTTPIVPFSDIDLRHNYLERMDRVHRAVKSYVTRAEEMAPLVDKFAFATPAVVALDLPRLALAGHEDVVRQQPLAFDAVLHAASVRLQIAFPDPALLQWDCGKLQRLAELLREKKAGGHRVLIFTQMTRVLDILEVFLNFHGYLYLRLDGATKIEDRQYITERFNADARIFCFIASSRSGGVGINLTGADTVVFYDSDFNPQMDRQCEDRAHRIGQIRDVHIYRFVAAHTVEEAMLRKADQKRSLDELVIQRGAFDWRTLFASDSADESALARALETFEDAEDRRAAALAAREEFSLVGQDEADFSDGEAGGGAARAETEVDIGAGMADADVDMAEAGPGAEDEEAEDEDEQGGTVVEYMLKVIEEDYEYFREWRL